MLILYRLRLLKILLHKKSQLSFSFFIIILLIFIFFVVFLEKNIINENLAYTFLVTTCSLTKNIKYNQIIKRFSHGGKKIGEKLAEKMAESMSEISKTSTSNTNMPHITSNQNSKGLPKYSPKKNDNQATQEASYAATPSPNQTSKNNFEDKVKNSSKQKKEDEDTSEATKSINKFINNENEKIREDVEKQTSYKDKVINEFSSSEENLPERPKLKEESEPIIIAINIKPKNPQDLTSEEKHICLGEQQDDGSIIVSAYYTSSAGHSKEKHNHGQPQNTRVSDTKIDGSYIPTQEKTPGIDDQGNKIQIKKEIRIPAHDNEDGGGMAVPSTTKGGQHIRKLHDPLKLEKDEYEVNKKATEYTQGNANIYKLVVDKHKEVTEENIVKNIDVEKYSGELNEEYDE